MVNLPVPVTVRVADLGVPPPAIALRLTTAMRLLSCVNHDCFQILLLIAAAEVKRLGLPYIADGIQWALMTLRTSDTSVWLLYVRYSAISAFPAILLCKQQAVVKGAVICAQGPAYNIRLSGRVFALHQPPPGPNDPARISLCLQLPMVPGKSSVWVLGTTTFLPLTHGLHYMTMNRSIAKRIIQVTGLHTADLRISLPSTPMQPANRTPGYWGI